MFHKVRLRLTLLFTGITTLILVVMSLLYILISTQNLRNNAFLSFQSDVITILSSVDGQSVFTYSQATRLEKNGKYIISLSDNGQSISYDAITKDDATRLAIKEAKNYYTHNYAYSADIPTSYPITHYEYSFTSSSGDNYFACVASIVRNGGCINATILHSVADLNKQIHMQYFRFLLIDLFAFLFIFFFSFYFTNYLLKPIEENQKRQVQFIASASHELRTPLAVMLSSLSAMEKADAKKKAFFMQSIKSEGLHLSKLVNEMLTLANADNQHFTIHPENTELDTLVLEIFESFEFMAKDRGLSLIVSLPEESLPVCFCDPDRIRQVLSIMISNALTYTPAGGSIKLALLKSGKDFHISIADNGIGIKDEEKKHVFDRFYRADNSHHEKEHFGLGLCIAKEIIDAHKGSITIKDTPGGGCTFIISLPFKNQSL